MVVVRTPALRIFCVGKNNFRGQHKATIKPGIDILHARVALEQKPGANEENERERDFSHDE